MRSSTHLMLGLLLGGLAACGGKDTAPTPSAGAKSAAAKSSSVKPTGRSVEVKMVSDARGERYDPVDVVAEQGDSLTFVLVSGVHNVHFPADRNPSGVKLPPVSQYLMMPGQKLGIFVDLPEGKYYFQCDAHIAQGMVGHLVVEGGS